MSLAWVKAALFLGGALALAGVSWFLPGWLIFVLTVALAKALVVLGVLVLLRGGLPSFGHGLFFATGAYTTAFAMRLFDVKESLVLMLLGALAGALMAAVVGLLLSRYRGTFHAMMSLAFSMILYSILLKMYSVTGGTDGMSVSTATIAGIKPSLDFLRIAQYYLVFATTALVVYGVYRFMHSPLGYLMRAVHDNEVRVEYTGVSAWQIVYRAYIISGALGGLGGVFSALAIGQVVPTLAYWLQSGEFLLVAVFGGVASVFGPVLGSTVFELTRNYAFKLSPYIWETALGTVMLLVIFFAPGGLWGILQSAIGRLKNGLRPGNQRLDQDLRNG